MSLTSFEFYCFFAITLLIYYTFPKKYQWIYLLIFSVFFFVKSSQLYTGIYLLVSIIVTTICSKQLYKQQEGKNNNSKLFLAIGIIVNISMLAALKYNNFVIDNYNNIMNIVFHKAVKVEYPNWSAPLGISFYTVTVIGYLLDCYWGIAVPQRSFMKNALFLGYYPLLTSGPIIRYSKIEEQLYSQHNFNYKNVCFGLQRFLWGVFKKIVLSSRIGVMVDTIYGDTLKYRGLYIWFAAAMFMLQLYTDFSGCMDIVIGASECYGINLPENFRSPFFSKSVQEYWQRWHITLGEWLKDYILYPILRSQLWKKMGKDIKKKFGKKAAKQIPSYIGMLCVWLLIGLWHGGKWKYIFGMGLWFWFLIMMEQITAPYSKKLFEKFRIDIQSPGWKVFQNIKVFILVTIGNMFFRLNSLKDTINIIKIGFSEFNPWIFTNESLYNLGISRKDFTIVIWGMLIVLLVSFIKRKRDVREFISRQNIVFRWLVYLSLLFVPVIFGMWGPGYDAQSFIYGNF